MSTPITNGRTLTQRIVSSQLALLILLIGAAAVFSLYVLLSAVNGNSEPRQITSQAAGQTQSHSAPNQDVLSEEWLKKVHSETWTSAAVVVPNDVLSEEWLKQNRAGNASVPPSRRRASQPQPDKFVGFLE